MAGKNLGKTDFETILAGATVLGSGGGGPRAMGELVIKAIGDKSVGLKALSDVKDDDWALIAAGIGSPDAAAHGKFKPEYVTKAVRSLAKATRRQFTCVFAAEIGAANCFMPMYVGADLGIPVVDAGAASRAVPMITMSTFAAAGVPVGPMAISSGEEDVGLSIRTAAQASGPIRAIISDPAFGQQAGLAIWPMTGKTLREHGIAGTVTMAHELGKVLADNEGPQRAVAVARHMKGHILGHGTVSEVSITTAGGFDMGRVVVTLDDGKALVILNKNENLIAWRSDLDRPVTIGPDLICYVPERGNPVSNASIKCGDRLSVIGAPCTAQMRSKGIAEVFRTALAGMGYPGPLTPLDKLPSWVARGSS